MSEKTHTNPRTRPAAGKILLQGIVPAVLGARLAAAALCLLPIAVFAGGTDVTIHDFANHTGNPEVSKLADSITTYFVDYFLTKNIPVARASGNADTTRILGPKESVVFGYLHTRAKKIWLTARIRIGLEEMSKELVLDPADDAERNASPAIDALFAVYERKLLSNVQIFSRPDSATLVINGDTAGVTPWESGMIRGKYYLNLSRDGYQTVVDSIFVSQSDNKYKFVLSPEGPTLEALLAARKARQKIRRRYSLVSLGGALLLGGTAVVSQLLHQNAAESYDQPALSSGEYDRYANAAFSSMYVRNIAIGLTAVCGTLSVILYF